LNNSLSLFRKNKINSFNEIIIIKTYETRKKYVLNLFKEINNSVKTNNGINKSSPISKNIRIVFFLFGSFILDLMKKVLSIMKDK
tara:strand:+ start:2980 stop:3234 length:255 start_codon:yes stop_codon:yes gene_type:complete